MMRSEPTTYRPTDLLARPDALGADALGATWDQDPLARPSDVHGRPAKGPVAVVQQIAGHPARSLALAPLTGAPPRASGEGLPVSEVVLDGH